MEYTIKGEAENLEQMFEMAGILEEVTQTKFDFKCRKRITTTYLNCPAAGDTESTSYVTPSGREVGFVYSWQIGINGAVLIGRKMEDFVAAIKRISKFYGLSEDKKMLMYWHNLQHDFQFIKKYFKWGKIFARKEKSVISAEIDRLGIEFRCSLFLTGCNLALVGKNLPKYKVEKCVGDLDYNLIRHWATPISDTERKYMLNDVLVIMSRIACEIEEAGGKICDIPLTKTGKVRKYCREKCLASKSYKDLMSRLTMESEEYLMLKECFTGGFTHASSFKSGVELKGVASFDFTSAYPSCMLLPDSFPMGKGQKVFIENREMLDELVKDNCVVFEATFEGVHEKFMPEHFMSSSKCYNRVLPQIEVNGMKKDFIDNGRIIEAEKFTATITEIDLYILEKCYDIDKITFGNGYVYRRGSLPKELIDCVLHFYEMKTQLKGLSSDDGSIEAEYALYKELLNSCFGCSVTDPVNDEISYLEEVDEDGNDWRTDDGDVAKSIDTYNKSKNRFLFYPWGVYICKLNMKHLWDGIFECGFDYCYSDTDSLKILHHERHQDWFDEYDKWIRKETEIYCILNGIDPKRLSPKDKNGKEHPLGVWDYETKGLEGGTYKTFKTLGAKRYLYDQVDKDGEYSLHCTIAGVNKKDTAKWLSSFEHPFDEFEEYMEVPVEYAGRNILKYSNEPFHDMVTDYLGNRVEVESLSGVYFSKSSYNLTFSPVYSWLVGSIEEHRI